MENQEINIEKKEDVINYYQKYYVRITDYIVGFLGVIFSWFIFIKIGKITGIIISIILTIILFVYFLKIKRKFIAFGILSIILVPFLILILTLMSFQFTPSAYIW